MDLRVEAWSDPLATWHHAVRSRSTPARAPRSWPTTSRPAPGCSSGWPHGRRSRATPRLAAASPPRCATPTLDLAAAGRPGAEPEPCSALVHDYPVRELVTRSPRYSIWVDRERALYGAWYEFFPRSIGAELADDPDDPARPARHGTFADATKHLDYVADMGFDVVYLPPIHPIGEVNRKGPNNTLDARPERRRLALGDRLGRGRPRRDPPASWARWRTSPPSSARARELDMEVALDLALQAAPDHPWVTEHPEWFTTCPTARIAYAENPPKKYQDIYPINFDNDPAGLSAEMPADHRCSGSTRGVKIFRVDNPHTKPLNFWQWLIGDGQGRAPGRAVPGRGVHPAGDDARAGQDRLHPELHLLHLAQHARRSWRSTRRNWSPPRDYMRPNFFSNTPDILHEYLQHGGPPAFAHPRRAGRHDVARPGASTPATSCSRTRRSRPGSEEYLDSEKYQLRPRDFAAARSRRAHRWRRSSRSSTRSGARTRRCTSCATCASTTIDNDAISCSPSATPATGDTVLVVVHARPARAPARLDVRWTCPRSASTGRRISRSPTCSPATDYEWGEHNYVRLDPHREPAPHLRRRAPSDRPTGTTSATPRDRTRP